MLTFLKYWSVHTEVSPSLAYKLWRETIINLVFTCDLLRKKDRIAAGSYMVTGALLGGETGSIVMFANPSGSLMLMPNFLQTVNFELLS